MSFRKGKTYEELYEIERAKKIKEQLSETHKGKHFSPKTEFKKGHIPWIKGKHHSEASRKKISECNRGKPSQKKDKSYDELYGIGRAEKIRERLKASHKGQHNSSDTEFKKGVHASPKTEFKKGYRVPINIIIKRSATVKRMLQENIELKNRMIKKLRSAAHKRPTRPEKRLIEIIEKYGLPYRYTGDGSFIVGGLNPDFVECNGRKIAVEVFGDYWHRFKPNIPYNQTLEGRKTVLSKYGWDLMVFWEHELKKPDAETLVLQRLNA